MTIILDIAPNTPPPDAELAARAHDAALVAQVRNASIAECQRFVRDHGLILARVSPEAGRHYMDAAALLEVLRS